MRKQKPTRSSAETVNSDDPASTGLPQAPVTHDNRRRKTSPRARATHRPRGGGPTQTHDEYAIGDIIRLLARWPGDEDLLREADAATIRARLHAALCAERRRGMTGHWAYDPLRHRNLVQSLKKLKPTAT